MYSTSEQKLFNLLYHPENPKGNNMQYILFVNQTQFMAPQKTLNSCPYQAFFCYCFITIHQNKTWDALIYTKSEIYQISSFTLATKNISGHNINFKFYPLLNLRIILSRNFKAGKQLIR